MKEQLSDNAFTTAEVAMELLGMGEDTPQEAVNNVIRLINAASAWIETMSGRKFGRADYVERCYGSGTQELCLSQYPIRSIAYIKDIRTGELILPEEYDITVQGHIGVVYKDNCWAYRGYSGGLSNDYMFAKRYLEVSYNAGYILPKDATEAEPADLPADLQNIVWGIIQQEFAVMRNGAQGLSAFSISGVSWTFDKEPRQSWTDTIAKYMRW